MAASPERHEPAEFPTVISLTLGLPRRAASILCLGAHADDIEIGCSGTVLRLLAERQDLTVWWIVFSATGERAREARRSAQRLLARAHGTEVVVHGFRDGFFPSLLGDIKEVFEALKGQIEPDLVLTHHAADRHQDHRVIAELTWNTFRDHLVLEYEVPKYDGGLDSPNVFVPLGRGVCRRKIGHLLSAFPSQRSKSWFTEDTFAGLLRLRGVESASPTGFAEGFHGRKLVVAC
jgi:LmbE family N-acetylglucosaminyl deacetylase